MTSCRRAAATICPHPGLQRKHAAAALSQAGRAGPPSANMRHPASQPAHPVRLTDVRDRHQEDSSQTPSSLNAPWEAIIKFLRRDMVVTSQVLAVGWISFQQNLTEHKL